MTGSSWRSQPLGPQVHLKENAWDSKCEGHTAPPAQGPPGASLGGPDAASALHMPAALQFQAQSSCSQALRGKRDPRVGVPHIMSPGSGVLFLQVLLLRPLAQLSTRLPAGEMRSCCWSLGSLSRSFFRKSVEGQMFSLVSTPAPDFC